MPDTPNLPEFDSLMQRGGDLHQQGQPEQALALFERALALRPDDLNAATACAAVLTELQRPQAAWALLYARRDTMLADADGACNLAIMAETCELPDEARAAYDRALALNPAHVRALNNRGLLASRELDWAIAVRCLQEAVELLPGEPALRVNLVDMLTGARDYAAALQQAENARQAFGNFPDLELRLAVLLAYLTHFEAAQTAVHALSDGARALLDEYLSAAMSGGRHGAASRAHKPGALELYALQAFNAMQDCDWRHETQLVAVLRQILAASDAGPHPTTRDWRDIQFHSMMLPLSEAWQWRFWDNTGISMREGMRGKLTAPAFAPSLGQRLRVGISAQSLADPRYVNALNRQIALHDRERFALFVYSPTLQPQAAHSDALRPFVENVVEIGHMSDVEACMRVRLDRLDLWVDHGVHTPLCRAEPVAGKVAAVHAYSQSWQRKHSTTLFDYSMADAFTHPDMSAQDYGAVVRLPYTCWLACNDDRPTAPATRASIGLPEQALVLACFNASVMLDPQTFALWMRALQSLPQAVLWLPAYNRVAQANLRQQAELAGVAGSRLHFLPRSARPDMLARMQLADLFMDTLRFNANHGLTDALRMGVPAVSCAGQSMASRLGGSILRAAGLADCVVDSEAAYLDKVLQLGRNPAELATLRQRLAAAHSTAPLFDTAARVRDWESAWITMIERQRAGLPPAAFDVPTRI